MRKLLLIGLLLITNVAFADDIPAGCYVADYYRTDDCYEDLNPFWFYTDSFSNEQGMINYYGSVLQRVIVSDQTWQGNYNILAKELTKNKKLVSKLRKACGAKCKKIK